MPRHRRSASGLLVLGSLCLALTGCWDKDGGPTTAPPQDPRAAQRAALAEKRFAALEAHHQACLMHFLSNPAAFGFGRMGERDNHPELTYPKSLQLSAGQDILLHSPAGQPLPEGTTPWTVSQFQLIGLAFHDRPVVYEAGAAVPKRQPKTRAVDEFEAEALGTLRNGPILVVRDEPGEVRMVGGIYAMPECLQCHKCERGKLLGAFTYRIQPVGAN